MRAASPPADPPREPTVPPAGFGRRRLLQLSGGLLGAGALGIPTGVDGAFAARQTSDQPVSMAMHIHGSFSEGTASMDAHLFQAHRLGVDVVWWTDHDFRTAAFGYRTAVGFDGASEPDGPWDWTWTPAVTGTVTEPLADYITTPHSPDESGGALRIGATAGPDPAWSSYLLEAVAGNLTYSTSYSDTTVTLDILPEEIGPDAQIVVEVLSSYRPATSGRPAGQYAIQYRIGPNNRGHHLENAGLLGVVGVASGALDEWQRITLDLRADHARLWPDTFSGDASLKSLRIGVRARTAAQARVVVDRLRFCRARTSPEDGMRLQAEAIAYYRERYPSVAQFAASEVSLVMHLNAFGGDHRRPRFHQTDAVKDPSVAAQRAMVDFLHSRGAVVSLNHPLSDSGGAENLASRLITTRGVGADVIEIGTTSNVATLERVFDIAARNAIFLTANGSTDDHEGEDWLGLGRRWLTSVWSPSRRPADLCRALKGGRAWFYDPLYWRGSMDLLVDGSTSMGGVHLTSKQQVPVQITATGMPRGSSLEVVVGRCDLAGIGQLTALNKRRLVPAAQVLNGRWTVTATRGVGIYVRAAVRSHEQQVIGFSNPVWVLPPQMAEPLDIPALRLSDRAT